VVVSFFLEKQYIPQLTKQAKFVLDYANVLIKMVANFGVINRVPAATPVHYVFYYPAVAHISTHSVNLAFGPKWGFKIQCRARVGLVISASGRVRASE